MRNLLLTVFTLVSVLCNSQTQFGVLVSFPDSSNTSANIIDVANQLGAKSLRQTVIMKGWDGTSTRFDQFEAAGFKVLLNVNWGNPLNNVPVPFPTDTVAYKIQLSKILDIHPAEVIVVENEEITEQYHSGPIQDYINELTAAVGVCHSKGLKVTNAGLLTTPLCILVYNDYLARGLTAEADDFKTRTFNPYMSYYLTHQQKDSALGLKVDKCKTLLAAFANLDLDYINFHLAEVVNGNTYTNGDSATPKVYQEIIDYITRTTGKPVISNEIAQKNLSPSLVTSMLNEFKKTNIDYALWYSEEGDNPLIPDSALHNYDGTLRLNGMAFSYFMADKTGDFSKPGLYASAISGYDTVCLNGSVEYKTFTVIGSSLNGTPVTIGPLSDFNFSTSADSIYSPTLTISNYGNSFTKKIYIQVIPGSLGYHKGGIPIYGGGVALNTVVVEGMVIDSRPDLSANVNAISCYGSINDGSIDITPTGGSGTFTYSWTSPDLPFYKSTTEDISALKPANYMVEVTSQAGCKTSATYTVIEPDKLDFTVAADSSIVCKNGSTTVTVSATGGTLPYTGTGVFTVNSGTRSYTVTDVRGCNKTVNYFVADGLNTVPSKPASITGTVADAHGVCGSGNYIYSINAVSGAASYTWGAPNGITIVSSNPDGTAATLTASSSFNSGALTVSANNACGTSPSQTKNLYNNPGTPGSISGPLSVKKNALGLVYNVSPVIDGLTYVWTVNNGAKITAGQNSSSITVTWGNLAGKVSVKAQNDCGTSGSISKSISIIKSLTDKEDTGYASEETDAYSNYISRDFNVMPNPARETAYLVLNAVNTGNYTVRITDLTGRVLQLKQIVLNKGQNKISIDIKNYTKGIYAVTLEDSRGLQKTTKLVKE